MWRPLRDAATRKVDGSSYNLPRSLSYFHHTHHSTAMNKSIWKSKTFWLQVATLASAMLPPVQAFLVANPVQFVAVLTAANTIMRFATSGKIEMVGEDAEE